MTTVGDLPADLTDLLNTADDALKAARQKDDVHTGTESVLVSAIAEEAAAKQEAFEAHQEATQKAIRAIDALRAYFGLTPT